MGSVTRLHHTIPISTEMSKALEALDRVIVKAVADAQAAGLPQGFVVDILRAQAMRQTRIMVV